jgi:hypothetical protein
MHSAVYLSLRNEERVCSRRFDVSSFVDGANIPRVRTARAPRRLVPRVGSCPASARAPRRLVPHQQHAHHHKDEVIVSTTEATIAIVFVVATP